MANNKTAKNPIIPYMKRKAFDMPTRDRLLALVQILQSYDKTNPVNVSELHDMLVIYYKIYLLSECMQLLKDANCDSDILSDIWILINALIKSYKTGLDGKINIDILIPEKPDVNTTDSLLGGTEYAGKRDEDVLLKELFEYTNDALGDVEYYKAKLFPALIHFQKCADYKMRCAKASKAQKESDPNAERLPITAKLLVHSFSFSSQIPKLYRDSKPLVRKNKKRKTVRKRLFFDPNYRSIFSTATLTNDLKLLEKYGILKRVNKRKVYGLSNNKSFDLWQLKIIFELVNSQNFLSNKERQSILDTILCVTSTKKHFQAVDLCHPLDSKVYSKTGSFRKNLEMLLDAQVIMIEQNKSFTVKFHYRHSKLDRKDRTPDRLEYTYATPLDIVAKDGHFYLVGVTKDGIRTYRIDRIIDLEYPCPDYGFLLQHPEYKKENNQQLRNFFTNNTNNYYGGSRKSVIVKWDFKINKHYTALFDIFGFDNIWKSDEDPDDIFRIKTRDNDGLYFNLLRFGATIEIVGPAEVRMKYSDIIKRMAEKY